MNWPLFALITYGFLLLLLLVGLILRSNRSNKRRYQEILEEKEQKLAAMQIDLEETLEALAEQAAAMEAQWALLQQQEQDTAAILQERIMEIQGNQMELQSRLLQLERSGLRGAVFSFPADRELRRITAAGIAETPVEQIAAATVAVEDISGAGSPVGDAIPEPVPMAAPEQEPPGETRAQRPESPAVPLELTRQVEAGQSAEKLKPRVKAMKAESRKPREVLPPGAAAPGGSFRAGEGEKKGTALELLAAGWSPEQIVRALHCSRVEVDMLAAQWKRGEIRGEIKK